MPTLPGGCMTRGASVSRRPGAVRLGDRCTVVWLLWLALVATGAAASPAAAPPGAPQHCAGDLAAVTGSATSDLADICAGVAAAVGFFAGHGVGATERLSIEVTRRLPEEAGPTASGCYIEAKKKIYVQPYAVFQKNKTWFGVKIDREMYRALATHEAAHALAACHFSVPNPTIQAKEYLAYVAMFSTMPPRLRGAALRATKAAGFQDLDRFTPMLYLFDPMRFGAEAYVHYSRSSDGAGIVRAILRGEALSN